MADFDYSTGPKKLELVVRPGMKYGRAIGGQTVIIDTDEYERGPTRETLYAPADHRDAVEAARVAREAALAPQPNQVRDGIQAQLERMWAAAAGKTAVEEQPQE